MRLRSAVRTGLAAVAAALAVAAMTSAPASADTDFGCGYPQVCFYKTEANWNARTWTAAYKDVTSGYQTLSSAARGAFAILNTRNDDGALLHFTNGTTWCLQPNHHLFNTPTSIADKIRIMDSPTC